MISINSIRKKFINVHHPTPSLSAGGGGGEGGAGWSSNQSFKKGGIDRTSTFRDQLLGKRWVTFLKGREKSLKNPTFMGGGFTKHLYRGVDCLWKGWLGQFADLSEAWQESVFECCIDSPMHTMNLPFF